MNQVDLFIIVVVLALGLSGAKRGFIHAAGDMFGFLFGLVLGSLAYPVLVAPLRWALGLSEAATGALAFVIVAVLGVVAAGWGFSRLSDYLDLPKLANRIGGAAFGTVFGFFCAAIFVMASGLLPNAGKPVKDSALGPGLMAMVPRLHEGFESVGLALPKLVHLPEDYREELSGVNQGFQFLRINFSQLDGATCIHCRSPVVFEGYHFSRGTLMSPRFRCSGCGRTSDGCQTFEGFHAIYGTCPVLLAREGVKFDCGAWPNGSWVIPQGPCPVCGREYVPETPQRAARPSTRAASADRSAPRPGTTPGTSSVPLAHRPG